MYREEASVGLELGNPELCTNMDICRVWLIMHVFPNQDATSSVGIREFIQTNHC